jgi:L-seryl-tRNA(Ser) seleniumtransferase
MPADSTNSAALLRQLPSVNDLLLQAQDLIATEGHDRTVRALRAALDGARAHIKTGGPLCTASELLTQARTNLQSPIPNLQSLINATGVILHTNLGRAPLSVAAQQAMLAAAQNYSPLEFDMETGTRGKRGERVEALLCELTGAEAAMVVNNCAFATVLMLAAHAAGRGVVVSRGQLVEIGGGFRVPDVMVQSGAKLIEIGTTNKVRIEDYADAINNKSNDVAAILRVHSSNFKIIGFTSEVALEDLVSLTQSSIPNPQSPIPVLDDLGSGALIDTSQFGLSREPMPQDSVRAGAHVICFSGDKLLGGPQAGLMVGQREAIARCRKHPLARAFRADKFTLAALEATLLHYARGEAQREVPVARMMALKKEEIAARAEKLVLAIGHWLYVHGLRAALVDGDSTVGGGSLPGETLLTTLVALEGNDPEALLAQLRGMGVIARIKEDKVLLDLRTVLSDDALIQRLK